jgi:hypothetical protein
VGELRVGLSAVNELGIKGVEQLAIEAMNRGWADLDHSVTVRLQEEAAGVEVCAPTVDLARAAAFITTHPDA